jgi:heme exporter protein C
MAFAAWMYTIAISLARVRSIIVEREQHSTWVGDLLVAEGHVGPAGTSGAMPESKDKEAR